MERPGEDPGSPRPAARAASQTRQYWKARPSCGLLIIEIFSQELNEDHPVAVSPHDATPASRDIEHHISGRNSGIDRRAARLAGCPMPGVRRPC